MQEQKMEPAKFQLGDLVGIGVTLVVVGIVFTYGIDIMADVRDDQTINSSEYNASVDSITGLAKFPTKLPTIAGVIIAAVIIGIVVRYMFIRARG